MCEYCESGDAERCNRRDDATSLNANTRGAKRKKPQKGPRFSFYPGQTRANGGRLTQNQNQEKAKVKENNAEPDSQKGRRCLANTP